MRDYAAIAEEYVASVLDGSQPACRWVRLACERRVADLKRQKRSDFPFRFDDQAAADVCHFIEMLPHTKGKWAIATHGRPESTLITLEPWQIFIQCELFGWLSKRTGKRRYRKAYICIPRKNGKSIIAAGDGLYMFAADGEQGAEVYSGATTEKQAWEVFRPAKQMAEKTPGLQNHFGVAVNAKNLHIVATGSRFEPVIGKPGDGASPSCAIVDEFHEHDSDEHYDTMLTGMGAREQPLMLVITTAGDNIAGPCYALQQEVQKVLEGSLRDDTLFGIIYTLDPEDDWTTEEALRKANPNYGVSVAEDFLRERQAEALRTSRKQNTFKMKHLNLWVSARTAWMNMEGWNRLADPALRVEDFGGEPCWLGLDLANKLDITAAVKVFKREIGEEDHFYVFGRYYLPEDRAQDPSFHHYQGWVHDGFIIATDGEITDFGRVRDDIEADSDQFQVQEVAYDTWGATQLATEIADELGLATVEFPMTTKHLSEPMKWLEALVTAGRIHHDGNPALAWMMSNVVVKPDANDNIFPRKDREELKIDGAVATVMALARAMAGESGASEYSEEGLIVFGGG